MASSDASIMAARRCAISSAVAQASEWPDTSDSQNRFTCHYLCDGTFARSAVAFSEPEECLRPGGTASTVSRSDAKMKSLTRSEDTESGAPRYASRLMVTDTQSWNNESRAVTVSDGLNHPAERKS